MSSIILIVGVFHTSHATWKRDCGNTGGTPTLTIIWKKQQSLCSRLLLMIWRKMGSIVSLNFRKRSVGRLRWFCMRIGGMHWRQLVVIIGENSNLFGSYP